MKLALFVFLVAFGLAACRPQSDDAEKKSSETTESGKIEAVTAASVNQTASVTESENKTELTTNTSSANETSSESKLDSTLQLDTRSEGLNATTSNETASPEGAAAASTSEGSSTAAPKSGGPDSASTSGGASAPKSGGGNSDNDPQD